LRVFQDALKNRDNGQTLSFDLPEEGSVSGVSDKALDLFRLRLALPTISKDEIFFYTYGVLSAPEFRDNFATDVKKSGPRVPLLKNFKAISQIGERLFRLQESYETAPIPTYLSVNIETGLLEAEDIYRLKKLRFSKLKDGRVDKSTIIFNGVISIKNIPDSANELLINGRTGMEWLLDQLRVSKDKDTGIVNDPNKYSDDPRFLLELVLRVIGVSVSSAEVLKKMPKFEY
jgi:predicted helicase